MFQGELWNARRTLSQNRTWYKRWETAIVEERARRLQRIADLEEHVKYLESTDQENAVV